MTLVSLRRPSETNRASSQPRRFTEGLNCRPHIPHIGRVSCGVVTVALECDLAGIAPIYRGELLPVGQIGSLVRIPQGLVDLIASVTLVGIAELTPPIAPAESVQRDERWLQVQLLGEIDRGTNRFRRGVGTYPGLDDSVHFATADDLASVRDQCLRRAIRRERSSEESRTPRSSFRSRLIPQQRHAGRQASPRLRRRGSPPPRPNALRASAHAKYTINSAVRRFVATSHAGDAKRAPRRSDVQRNRPHVAAPRTTANASVSEDAIVIRGAGLLSDDREPERDVPRTRERHADAEKIAAAARVEKEQQREADRRECGLHRRNHPHAPRAEGDAERPEEVARARAEADRVRGPEAAREAAADHLAVDRTGRPRDRPAEEKALAEERERGGEIHAAGILRGLAVRARGRRTDPSSENGTSIAAIGPDNPWR